MTRNLLPIKGITIVGYKYIWFHFQDMLEKTLEEA